MHSAPARVYVSNLPTVVAFSCPSTRIELRCLILNSWKRPVGRESGLADDFSPMCRNRGIIEQAPSHSEFISASNFGQRFLAIISAALPGSAVPRPSDVVPPTSGPEFLSADIAPSFLTCLPMSGCFGYSQRVNKIGGAGSSVLPSQHSSDDRDRCAPLYKGFCRW
jgi:hypothetical protein